MPNVELDRLEKMVEAYYRAAHRAWEGYDGTDSDFAQMEAFKAILKDIKQLKEGK
jgi:hypothetical protein